LQVGEKAGKAGLFTNPFATLPHRVGERQVPGCVRNLARAEWFPFGWCGEVLARSRRHGRPADWTWRSKATAPWRPRGSKSEDTAMFQPTLAAARLEES
jgi:hypothetical protein